MNKKNDILESWIMVEHLSEGDINLKDKAIQTFRGMQKQDYYSVLTAEIQEKRLDKYKKSGIVIYFEIFPFQEVIDFLREEYKLTPTEQELTAGNKFSFALYFDKKLIFDEKKTFVTESYYIRKKKRIPKETEFRTFEKEMNGEFEEMFECPEGKEYREHFNQTLDLILTQHQISVENCRMQAVTNMESDATNLHSFFIADLEKAKRIQTRNLDKYIMGDIAGRRNLNCRKESEQFNPEIFYDILEPENYPIGRFPSNPQFSLALMQQVAVNLSIGFDNEQIRSVNGPPGTGKTTLLKDIFSELIVEQAYEMASLSSKYIKGTEKTKYWGNASIGCIPEAIAEKGIVVASSNHGAVQNIVDELPLIDKIDKEFLDAIVSADYFKEIANSFVETEWVDGEKGKQEVLKATKKEGEDKFWGLFSLEGGKKDNMDYIVTVLKHVVHELEEEYRSNDTIYSDFLSLYHKVCAYRSRVQTVSQQIIEVKQLQALTKKKIQIFRDEESRKKTELEQAALEQKKEIENIRGKLDQLKQDAGDLALQLQMVTCEKDGVLQGIEALKLQKPGLFSRRKYKTAFAEKNRQYSEQLQIVIDKERKLRTGLLEGERQEKSFREEIGKRIKQSEAEQAAFMEWERTQSAEIRRCADKIAGLREKLQGSDIHALNLDLDYEALQLSNPWFDIEYRRLQSQLFIKALEVRKQFLYTNVKNIKAAYIIWSKQKEYLEQKNIIAEAWHWINMTIPVIGSTFASFSRMCTNLGKETLGHLFIDEAGQALPQAGVGAIFRSRHVMAVGDPAQIKPVLTLDANILKMLGTYYGVSEQYLSETASTQTLIDEISQYGFYKDLNQETWIGIPLWVHRRCRYPMFDISNTISYGGNMVQGDKKDGVSEWYDIKGHAADKYVAEQGIFLKEKIQAMIKENPDIINKEKKDIIYVISPFKNVAYQLSRELKKIGFTRCDKNGKPTNIGTVHTFQGKEAPIVFLVLGADEKCVGAANWAVGTENPNIMNVAATRAKTEFYIIGDKKLYLSLHSDVINGTYRVIENHKEKIGQSGM